MKKISLLMLTLSASTTLAIAEKVAVVPTAPCPPQPCPCPQAFQGLYLGGSFGFGVASIQQSYRIDRRAGTTWAKNKETNYGFDGGLLLGYNYVFSNKLGLGLEAYFNWTTTSGNYSQGQGAVVFGRTSSTLKNAIQIRVPFSYVICNLVAPKIFVGWDNSSWVNGFQFTPAPQTYKSRYNGVLWGLGVDFLLAKHIISGLEYTGIASQSKTSPVVGGESMSLRPLYNTFKATLKFIY